ncbi:MAG: radical SAM protein [Tepidisphaeraceae bacterium]
MTVKQWAAAVLYGFRLLALRQKSPLFVGLVMSDRCNLDCFYCQTKNLGRSHFTYTQVATTILDAYRRGHRFLYITGGEPTLWKDGEHTLADVVALARQNGFFSVFVYTNGTHPLNIAHCGYVVTVDGPKRIHDAIRGGTWELIMDNVRAATPGSIYVSITLTQANVAYLEEFVREITHTGLFRAITFNLLTHQPDFVREHGFDRTQRENVLDDLWNLKQRGYPIALSHAAYRALRKNSFRRPIPQIEVITSQRIFPCCRDVFHPEVCENCGYSGCAEVSQILALKPSAILEGLRIMQTAR